MLIKEGDYFLPHPEPSVPTVYILSILYYIIYKYSFLIGILMKVVVKIAT